MRKVKLSLVAAVAIRGYGIRDYDGDTMVLSKHNIGRKVYYANSYKK